MFIARCQLYPVRDGRPPREAVVLVQVDPLIRQLRHLERPEEVRDGEEDLALGERHARADATAVKRRGRRQSARVHDIASESLERDGLPGPERPVVALHRVREIGGLGTGQMVVEISLGLW